MMRLALAVLLALAGGCAAGHAEGAGSDAPPPRLEGEALFNAPRQGPELWIGGGPLTDPRYPGAARNHWQAVPVISGGWGDWLDFDFQDGATLTLLRGGGFSAGIALRARFGRRVSDDRQHLQGLRSFDDTVELGGFLAYEAGPFGIETALTQDPFRNHGGAVWETRTYLEGAIGRVGFGGGPFVRAGSRSFMQSYFGVPEGAAAQPPYEAHAGFESVGVMGQAEWRITDRFALRCDLEAARLVGSAAHSPIVRGPGGSPDQLSVGVFAVFRAF